MLEIAEILKDTLGMAVYCRMEITIEAIFREEMNRKIISPCISQRNI
jgi:hypothetical protein